MSTTRAVAKDVRTYGQTSLSEPISAGQYMLACASNYAGATVEEFLNIGFTRYEPLGVSYRQPSTDIIWLPRCTAYLNMINAGGGQP